MDNIRQMAGDALEMQCQRCCRQERCWKGGTQRFSMFEPRQFEVRYHPIHDTAAPFVDYSPKLNVEWEPESPLPGETWEDEKIRRMAACRRFYPADAALRRPRRETKKGINAFRACWLAYMAGKDAQKWQSILTMLVNLEWTKSTDTVEFVPGTGGKVIVTRHHNTPVWPNNSNKGAFARDILRKAPQGVRDQLAGIRKCRPGSPLWWLATFAGAKIDNREPSLEQQADAWLPIQLRTLRLRRMERLEKASRVHRWAPPGYVRTAGRVPIRKVQYDGRPRGA